MNNKLSIINYQLSILLLMTLLFALPMKAQVNVGKDSISHSFSVLEVTAEKQKGGLRLPQLTTAQRDALALKSLSNPADSLAKGLTIFNTTTGCLEYWNGTVWVSHCNDVDNSPAIALSPITLSDEQYPQMTVVVCDYTGVTITASIDEVPGAHTYSWSVPSGLSVQGSTTGNSVTFTTTTPGAYTLQVTVDGRSTATRDVQIWQLPNSLANAQVFVNEILQANVLYPALSGATHGIWLEWQRGDGSTVYDVFFGANPYPSVNGATCFSNSYLTGNYPYLTYNGSNNIQFPVGMTYMMRVSEISQIIVPNVVAPGTAFVDNNVCTVYSFSKYFTVQSRKSLTDVSFAVALTSGSGGDCSTGIFGAYVASGAW